MWGPHTHTVYSTSSLFKHAIRSGNYCLTGIWETNVQVALAALELFGGLAELPVENISEFSHLPMIPFLVGQSL